MLKPIGRWHVWLGVRQPPSGGCVLKLLKGMLINVFETQPPSGGCVLKPIYQIKDVAQVSSRLRAAVC